METNRKLLIALLGLLITACAPFSPNDRRASVCNELNSKIIFSGSTTISRNADIQNSELALLQRQYEKYHCDQR